MDEERAVELVDAVIQAALAAVFGAKVEDASRGGFTAWDIDMGDDLHVQVATSTVQL